MSQIGGTAALCPLRTLISLGSTGRSDEPSGIVSLIKNQGFIFLGFLFFKAGICGDCKKIHGFSTSAFG